MTATTKTQHTNIRAVKMPWGQTIVTFMWKNTPHVFAKDICDHLNLSWKNEELHLMHTQVLTVNLVSAADLGLGDDDVKHYALPITSLHGYLFSITEYEIEDEVQSALLAAYKRDCVKALDTYWRFGKAVNLAFFINEECRRLRDDGMLDFTPEKDTDKYLFFVDSVSKAARRTTMPESVINAAMEQASIARLSGMNDIVAFVKALSPVTPQALRSKTSIDRMLVSIVESDYSDYVQDHLADYLANNMIESKRGNLFRGIREELRSEAQREVLLMECIETMVADFIVDMMGQNCLEALIGDLRAA